MAYYGDQASCATYQEFLRFYYELKILRICPVIVRRKKMMGIKGDMIKVKVSHLNDLARLRALKEVELVPVLLTEVLVLLVRGEVVDFQRVIDFKGREILEEKVLICAADVIIGILESVGGVAVDVLLVGSWDMEL
ncbi:hypothetical protein EV1_029970 [Malus domestica]